MTSHGTPHGRFQRAIERRHLLFAETAARELGQLSLPDALALTLLIAEQAPVKYDKAAVRWHVRYCSELPGVDLAEAFQVLAALNALREERVSALVALAALSRERGRFDVAKVAEAAVAPTRPRARSASSRG